jgi:hypothetical protein
MYLGDWLATHDRNIVPSRLTWRRYDRIRTHIFFGRSAFAVTLWTITVFASAFFALWLNLSTQGFYLRLLCTLKVVLYAERVSRV